MYTHTLQSAHVVHELRETNENLVQKSADVAAAE